MKLRYVPGKTLSLHAALFHERIAGFFLIGIFSTLVDLGLLYLLTTGLGIWYLASATVSYSCGMLLNYLLNKFLNFHDTCRDLVGQFLSFALISLAGLGLTLAILCVAVEAFGLSYLAGKLIAILVAFA